MTVIAVCAGATLRLPDVSMANAVTVTAAPGTPYAGVACNASAKGAVRSVKARVPLT